MNTPTPADLLVPILRERVQYKTNFLKQVVCEMRFPLLPSLGEGAPPVSFLKALRKRYPHAERGSEMMMAVSSGAMAAAPPAAMHVFRSMKLDWVVSLKNQSISVETSRYQNYEAMRERVLEVVAAAKDVIDSEFFTRVGLRYINVVPTEGIDMTEWINPALVGCLGLGGFQGVAEHSGRLLLQAADGGVLLQHGLAPKPSASPELTKMPDYVLDIDAFRTEIPLEQVANALDAAHKQCYALFDWTLGRLSREKLSK